MTTMEFKARKMLVEEALDFASFNRRSLLVRTGALAGASLLGGSFARTADAEEIKPATGGKKVRIGIPLTYGPFNQPWRRGCWQLVKTVLDLGGEPVTIRGEPTKRASRMQNVRCSIEISIASAWASIRSSWRRLTSPTKLRSAE